jgi:anti-anti-sigma factor
MVDPLVPSSQPSLSLESLGTLDVVRVYGELDLAYAEKFEAMLTRVAESGKALAVDLSQCRYIDTTIISVFIRVRRLLGEKLTLIVPPSGSVDRIFKITGLAESLGVVPNLVLDAT